MKVELHTGEDVTPTLSRRRIGFPYLTVDVDGSNIFIFDRGEDLVIDPEVKFTPPQMKEFRLWFDAYKKRPRYKPGLMYTRRPGTPIRVGLVACSKTKMQEAAIARDMYQGDLFKKAASWAEKNCNEWGILSAKYGLLHPRHWIKPYNITMEKKDKDHRVAWARRVNGEVYSEWGEETTYVLLCGALYRLPFEEYNVRSLPFEVPMRGLGLGEQKSWLKKENQCDHHQSLKPC